MITALAVGLVLIGAIGMAVTSAKAIIAKIPNQFTYTALFVALFICGSLGIVWF